MSCSIGQKLVKERMPAEEENIPYNQQYLKLNYSFWFKKKKKRMVLELKKPMIMLSGSFDSGHG